MYINAHGYVQIRVYILLVWQQHTFLEGVCAAAVSI